MSSSPNIYINRYNERFKSLVDSPPREPAPTLKNSPLRPTFKDDYKVFEGEKYTSYEIQNEDCGEWRESEVLNNSLNNQVAKSPRQPQKQQQAPAPTQQKPKQQQTLEQPVKEQLPKEQSAAVVQEQQPVQQLVQQPVQQPVQETVQQAKVVDEQPQKSQVKRKVKKAVEKTVKSSTRSIPKYMQATASFYNKAHSKNEPVRQTDNVLRPRSQGGITKRTSPSKISRRQPTTTQNAAKSPYVSMAARAKLFEQGLRNGSLDSPPAPTKSTSSKTTHSSSSSSVPHYAQQTSITMIRRKELEEAKAAKSGTKRTQKLKEPKPFHFATNDRASRYNRHKQVLTDINNVSSKGLKRKHQSSESSIRPNQKSKSS